MFKLKGVIPPMITPFQEDGTLDEKSLIHLVEYLSERVDGLFICGSYGCGALMTIEERKRVAEIVKKYARKDLTIVVHTGTTNTIETIELTRHARDIGCDAASSVGPYYYKYQDIDLYHYYADILKETGDFPFYVYHNPGFQGYKTSLKVLKDLKELGLHGVKDATFDILEHATYMRERADDNFDIALGTEAMWVSAHALGCRAYIPGIGNVYPELCTKMYEQSMSGDAEGALATQFKINKLRTLLYLARSTQLAIYAIAELRGIMKAYPRAPFVAATPEEMAHLRDALAQWEAE